MQRVDEICVRFENAWKAGQRPRIEDYLGNLPHPERSLLFRELLRLEVTYRRQIGEMPTEKEYAELFAGHVQLVQAVFREPPSGSTGQGDWACQQLSTPPKLFDAEETDQPIRLGRYRITARLGAGGFGVVYKGYDEELHRDVAIKVPHKERLSKGEGVESYLAEARVLAILDHPHIVPVHDVGRTDDGLCYVVSKYIEGSDLAKRLKQARPSFIESTQLVAIMAEALQYAHQKRLVHRDLKPANILLDSENKPYLTDFGLALKEEDFGKATGIEGTPAYMSPEQANGEGHLVDGRSDIFSLGMVFYELLTGRRPFIADTNLALLALIAAAEVRPPRQTDPTIPRELERICLKALAKRATERYTTAFDLADDLRHWLSQQAAPRGVAGGEESKQPVKILPKGLRSFDATDADFFLELLPGPRDRNGLPDSIRFWKSRIEEADPDNTFRMGLIYGPSGCGKSSLVKAGLLPRLTEDVIAVYVEATAEETESRLLNGLRKHCPDVPTDLGLMESMTSLRRGQLVPAGKKVLLILDQFEQWLHAKREEQDTGLVQALRQCDGIRVQCLVMVRDDFWLAVSRFMTALEVELVQGRNMALVDLFDPRHAHEVLCAFGQAFGALPEHDKELSDEQRAFLDQAVAGLTQDGKIIPVRLALFAEMVKGKPWTPATLKEVGGTEGVGVAFLEETFSASTANPKHRLHQQAARSVLTALLPETGMDIRGNMRSQQELLEASGYAATPKDFAELLRILDSELRLITPTDPEGREEGGRMRDETDIQRSSLIPHPSSFRYYQLTHDYLVHSLRDWLTRKQKATRRGRAELLLADLAAVWTVRPEHRRLPSLWQWLNIRLLTRKKDWTQPQRKMMEKSGRYHAVRNLVFCVIVVLAGWGGYEGYGRLRAQALLDQLLKADTKNVPGIVAEMAPYRRWIDPLLRDTYQNPQASNEPDLRRQLHASIALLSVDASQAHYLYSRLLDATPQEVCVLREVLTPHQEDLGEKLWELVEHPTPGKEHQRLRAACALAKYDPQNERWATVAEPVVDDFVSVPAAYLEGWMDSLKPVSSKLQAALQAVFRDTGRTETKRSLAASILADYLAARPLALADLLMDADEKQFPVLHDKFQEKHKHSGWTFLEAEIDKPLEGAADETAKERLAKRQANAAVALLGMNRPARVWPLLKHRVDPRVRSYLVHRLGPMGVEPGAIVKRLHEESDVTIRRALILSLGEVRPEIWPPGERESFVAELQDLYRTAPDPGLHASAAWLLRQWKQEQWLKQFDQEWAKDKDQRQKRIQDILANLAESRGQVFPHWYVNSQRQTMVVIPAPVEFMMGSRGQGSESSQHRHRIRRPFAISATAVTQAQYRYKDRPLEEDKGPDRDHPAVYKTWFDGAAYCNWLSDQEGIDRDQWCYEINADGQVKLRDKYLSRTGYRLPTEAEMEYANRAGAVSKRFYGESEELLEKYGWYVPNSKGRHWPVGSLKPNDFGLFDTHGNVWCWCQEPCRPYPRGETETVFEDQEGELVINPTQGRAMRGNCYTDQGNNIRCAKAWYPAPTYNSNIAGFRVARTMRAE
jgi:serine/threonine protein kinase/formylglycine-generating enzyme required for sulfatase activity